VLKATDILVLIGLLLRHEEKGPTQASLAKALHLSQPTVHRAVKQLERSRLWRNGLPQRPAIRGLLVHGVPYVFPVSLGSPARGVPTAHAGPWLGDPVASSEAYVWPYETGEAYGLSVEPLHSSVPGAALEKRSLHEWMALVDTLRIGRVRERNLAERRLDELLDEAL
jgi:hypothetical protein